MFPRQNIGFLDNVCHCAEGVSLPELRGLEEEFKVEVALILLVREGQAFFRVALIPSWSR
jgi:hypothetical protein